MLRVLGQITPVIFARQELGCNSFLHICQSRFVWLLKMGLEFWKNIDIKVE